MEEEYRKTLNRPEAKHRYWHVQKADRDFFPPAHKIFNLKFHDKTYKMKVNHKDDIMTGKLYANYKFLEGDPISIIKAGEMFVLTAKKTKPW